ncbi:hypothetical protein SAMN05216412_11364 [Nitrosospira multiformis]|uniref:Uncharacterized protein n=1 Tax=Nitrosospira multiformis TaxID=1231 RepID=A0A1I0GKH8_9PROT|nr:hypothetical protein [Nitrosospira multiformis]SET70557.1 hypothetical protein SAMN05216412_11364 [Nitrosospira multiformis]
MYASLVLSNQAVGFSAEYESTEKDILFVSGSSQSEDNKITENTEASKIIITLEISDLVISSKISSGPIEILSNTGDIGMEAKIEKIESDISNIGKRLDSIDASVKNVNATVDPMRGIKAHVWFANAIATLTFAALGIIANFLWNNISSLDGKAHELTKDVSAIKTDINYIKSDIKELKENTNSKLDKLLERSSNNQ